MQNSFNLTNVFWRVMKRILKMLLIVFVCVIGAFGLVLGGLYIFGGFNEHSVYAENLTFSSAEVVSSGTFGLQVDTTTDAVNKTSLVLETSNGGESVIEYPKTITIGESFRVAPKKLSGSEDINVGGYVELYARYIGSSSNQGVVAVCKILIDVEIEEVAVKMSTKVMEVNDSIQIASSGEPLESLLEINPINSLLPYSNREVFGTISESSKFSTTNLVNKKLYLEVFSLENNPNSTTNENIVKFAVGSVNGTENSVIEVEYEYDSTLEAFVFSNDIFIKPGVEGQIGEMCLKAYYCPTYASQKNVTITNIREEASSTSISKESFNITNYSVDDISMNTADRTIYLNKDTFIYINNSTKENNLGIALTNDNNGEIEESIYKNNIYISVETENISYILSKSNGDTTKNVYGLNTYIDDQSEMSEWCWKFKLTDFLVYYNYTSSPVNANKVKIKIEYNDGVDSFIEYFYIIPEIHKVDALSVIYASNEDTSFYTKSGVSFQLTPNNFDYDYTVTPTYTDLAYYIPYDSNNEIVTIPMLTGNYSVSFDFIISIDNTLSFNINGDWCSIKSSNVVFTQGSKSYSIPYSAEGVQSNVTNMVQFSAGQKIHCEMQLTMLENITSSTVLFSVNAGNQTLQIDGEMAKFYAEGSDLPILFINDVSYGVDFEYFEDGEGKYIHILSNNSTYILSGIGSFSIIAELVYEDFSTGTIYWLGKSATLNVYAYTDLTSLTVKHYNPTLSIATFFDRDGIFYDEGSSETPANYLYVSCESEQLDALKKYYEKGDLIIDFSQNYGELNTSLYGGVAGIELSDINTEAITFGSWQEVITETSFAGYVIPYYINEIYSIEINGEELANLFEIVIYIDTDANDDIYAEFAYSSIYFEPYLSININDLILTSAELTYSGSSKGTSDDPLTLTANTSGGSFAWNDGSSTISNLPVQYSFLYESGEKTISHMTKSLTLADTSAHSVSNVDAFYELNLSSSGGGLTFKNFPHYEDGVLVKLRIYTSDAQSNETTHFVWTENGFVKTINSSISEGVYLYFNIIGLELDVIALNNTELVGYEDNAFELFGMSDAIFSLNNDETLNGFNDFSQIFSVTVANQYAHVNETYSQIIVNNDFLIDGGIDISLSYANNEKINIETSPDTYVQSYTQMVSGAFQISAQTVFLAPSVADFCTITYKKDDSDAVGGNMVEASISKISSANGGNDTANNTFTINGNSLTFRTITGSLSTKIRLNLRIVGTELETYKDYNITINSIYNDSNITVGTLDGESGEYLVTAGIENQVTIIGEEIVLSGNLDDDKDNINGITLSFENAEEDELEATQHMRSIAYQSGPNIGLYSFDLNYDKNIIVTFTISFEDGGSFVATKNIKIIKNISLLINVGGFTKNSGDLINFDNATYTVSKVNGVSDFSIPDTDFTGNDPKYDASSFIYDGTYFEDFTPEGGILVLKVAYQNETVPSGTVETTITFNYNPDGVEYELQFSYVFTLNINSI